MLALEVFSHYYFRVVPGITSFWHIHIEQAINVSKLLLRSSSSGNCSSLAQEIYSHHYYSYLFLSTYAEYPLLLSPFLPSQHRPISPSLPEHHHQVCPCPNMPSSLCLLPRQMFPETMIAPTSLLVRAPLVSPLRQGLVYRSFRCNFYFVNKIKHLVNQRHGEKNTQKPCLCSNT